MYIGHPIYWYNDWAVILQIALMLEMRGHLHILQFVPGNVDLDTVPAQLFLSGNLGWRRLGSEHPSLI